MIISSWLSAKPTSYFLDNLWLNKKFLLYIIINFKNAFLLLLLHYYSFGTWWIHLVMFQLIMAHTLTHNFIGTLLYNVSKITFFLHFPNNKVSHIKILYYLNGFHLSVVQQLGNNKSQANKNSNKARVN